MISCRRDCKLECTLHDSLAPTECCASHTGSSDQCLKVCEAASGKGRLRGSTYRSLFVQVTITVWMLRPKNNYIHLIEPVRKRGGNYVLIKRQCVQVQKF